MVKPKPKLTTKDQYETALREAEKEIGSLRAKLKMSIDERQAVDQKWGEQVDKMKSENAILADRNKELEERLKKADGRISQLIDANESATDAAGSIARVTRSLGMALDTLEVKLEHENKEKARRFRS